MIIRTKSKEFGQTEEVEYLKYEMVEKNSINRWTRLRLDQMNEISLSIIQKIFEFEQVFEKEQCDLLVSL